MTWSSLGPLAETRIAIGWNDRLRCIAADLAVLSTAAALICLFVVLIQLMLPKPAEQTS